MAAAAHLDRPTESARGLSSGSLHYLLFVAVFCALFAQNLVGAEVFAPDSNDRALGVASAADTAYPHSNKHGDFSRQFIPRLHQQLKGDYSSWLATWDPYTELGRPVMHGGGYSPAFPVTNLLSRFHTNPHRLFTHLMMITLFLSGTFAFLLLRELHLHPAAALTGALALSLGTRSIYWITFHQFHVPICGALALLWLSLRFLRSNDRGWLVAIAFAIYCMLLAGRVQMNILLAYVLAPALLYFIVSHAESTRDGLIRAGWLALAAGSGAVAVLPLYIDLYATTEDSARLSTDIDFFLQSLPRIDSLGGAADYLAGYVSPAVFGNALSPEFSGRFNGSSPGPTVFSLGIAAPLLLAWRRAWIWLVPLAFFFALTASETLFAIAVRNLGFSFSRGNPLLGALVPMTVLAAYAADAVLREPARARRLGAAAAMAAAPLFIGLARLGGGAPLDSSGTAWVAATVALVAAFAATARPWLLVGAAVFSVFVFSQPLLLSRPLESIRVDSDLARALRETVGPGERYAKLGRAARLVPSNQERIVGVGSIHSYNSLSSRRYQEFAKRLSPWGTQVYGRHFDEIGGPDVLDAPELDLAVVSVLLSSQPLESARWETVGRAGGVHVYRSTSERKPFAQVLAKGPGMTESLRIAAPEIAERLPAQRTSEQPDHQTFNVTHSAEETLLFISQQYHPAWKARSDEGTDLATRRVNDFYQGVIVPAGTNSVSIRFEPFVRWMWLPQALFVAAGCWLVARASLLRRRRGVRAA